MPAALGYAGLVAYHRARYGKVALPVNDDSLLLDRFIPTPEVVERHRVRIAAPPDVVMATARSMELFNSRVWTLHADPIGETESMFHTETRVATTDPETRKRFRRYWSYVAPGVELIRLAMLRPLKNAAERRAGRPAAAVARDVH